MKGKETMKSGITFALLLLESVPCFSQTPPKSHTSAPLVVGWHDEMNRPENWKPLALENQPDIYAESPGLLTLRLPHVPEGFPYEYQWSGVTRSLSADLAHYPVLVANVGSMDAGSYAHLDIEEHDFSGHVTHTWRSPTLTHPGLTSIDLGKAIDSSVRRLTVRLIVGGKLAGAKCSYNWVRFVRREDLVYLQEVPGLQYVTSREPISDISTPPQSDHAQR